MARRTVTLMEGWSFTSVNGAVSQVDLPHTWNGKDGQSGGNNYCRGRATYERSFAEPEFQAGAQRVYLEFQGVNAAAEVLLNGQAVCRHQGGYSAFRADVTDLLQASNQLKVLVDNSVDYAVYPQRADFTFYGGIYRDVNLLVVSEDHFALDDCGGPGVKVTATVARGRATVRVESSIVGTGTIRAELLDAEGGVAARGEGADLNLEVANPHLWNGVADPYLYTVRASLVNSAGKTADQVCLRVGLRSFRFDSDQGFFLNEKPYPLRGVSRHQDWRDLGNAITPAHHDRDMELIREVGANTIRLAHYQHDQYFYDLCDRYGMVVWAEIPYISEHRSEGRENTLSQMRELIAQNRHHACIVTWGLSNEITIKENNRADMLENHRLLNNLCHGLDPSRPTTLACYAMCNPFWKVVHVSDIVAYNLYLGWYVPGLKLNDLFLDFFHWKWPKRCLGYSEYGAEGMPNLHASKPRRGDQTEEYQAKYHAYMLECFARHPFLWGTYVWNMFDFAADARDQGGEPGMNHKGLITFDRKTKKDSFYIYKAWWSDEPFVHLCSRRYADRPEAVTEVKVYSNQSKVALYADGKLLEEREGRHVFTFRVPLEGTVEIEARAGESRDEMVLRRVSTPNPAYQLVKTKSKNWV